ncbi:NAD(P)-dependent oxidoreductase [Leifsonia xyli]
MSWGTVQEGTSLYGLDVVIVGAGGIARELLRLLEPFGVRATIVWRSAEPVPGSAATITADRLGEVLPAADVVVIAAALTDSTRRLIGAREFAAMKSTAVFVNIARGGLVDSNALVTALRTGAIAGAGVDVTDPEPLPDGHPLWAEKNCIVNPAPGRHAADGRSAARRAGPGERPGVPRRRPFRRPGGPRRGVLMATRAECAADFSR